MVILLVVPKEKELLIEKIFEYKSLHEIEVIKE